MQILTHLTAIIILMMSLPSFADSGSDLDRDGIPDIMDYCPNNSFEELSKGVHNNGCPLHSDNDSTPDYRDRCPNTPRGVKTNAAGCPLQAQVNVSRIFVSSSLINMH